MPFNSWEDAISAMALGDSEATSLIASQLAAFDQVTSAAAAKSAVQTEVEKLRGMQAFAKKVNLVAKEYPDVLDPTVDPEAYQLAVKVDSRIAARSPDMDEDERLRRTCEAVRQKLGDHQERDYASAISSMRSARKKSDLDASEVNDSDYDPVEAEIEAERSQQIATMAKERLGRQVEQRPKESRQVQRYSDQGGA